MIKIENTEIYGWEAAIRGMRNPMNSWEKSDSHYCEEDCPMACNGDEPALECDDGKRNYCIGRNDLELMQSLIKAGSDHRKFLRMINVTMDITAPLYWWKEFDTYKVGTVRNSCSTMHKIHEKEFTLDDFSCEHLMKIERIGDKTETPYIDVSLYCDSSVIYSPWGLLTGTICLLNNCRKWYLETKDKKYWWQMIQLLPSSYNQRATIQLNYEVLLNMYHSRKNHKLDEWREFCKLIENLPYMNEFIGGNENDN